MVKNCESYLWEYGTAEEAFSAFYSYLSREYQTEYRRNTARFNIFEEDGSNEHEQYYSLDSSVTAQTDEHGFTTLGSYAAVILDTELGGSEVGDRGTESFGGIRAVPTPPVGTTTSKDEHVEHYEVPDITSLLPEGKYVTADGKVNPGIRELWDRWLAKRTDEERDIIAVWVRMRSFNEVMEILGCNYDDVARIQSMVQNFGDRHKEKLVV